MIPPLPRDAALPGLWALLDEDALTPMLAARLGGEVRALTPTYIRYKPGTSCLVQYDLTVRTGDGDETTLGAYIKLFADGRAQRQASGGRMRRLRERVAEIPPVIRRDAYIPELDGLLHLYPVDYDLRHLARFAQAPEASAIFRQALPEWSDLVVDAEPGLVRYKAERKALLRYQLSNGPANVLYGKVFADDRVDMHAARTRAMIEAGIATPPVMIAIPGRQFVAHAEAPGTQLGSLRGSAAHSQWMAPLAETLRHLQAVAIPDLRVHRLADEAFAIAETARLLGRVVPPLAGRLDRLASELASRLVNLDEHLATSHGDFYDDQVLVSKSGVTIIDLDELRCSHPLLDVGNMLAHLASGRQHTAREAFLDAALLHATYSASELAVFEAAALLKLAPGPFRRLEADWPAGIERILTLAETRLGDNCHYRRGPGICTAAELAPPAHHTLPVPHLVDPCVRPCVAGNFTPHSSDCLPKISDPALPQLATLQDPAAMISALATFAEPGSGGHLARITLVRHKPGRRAIFRYELDTGERFYGKTFASGRGPKVFEIAQMIASSNAFGPDTALPEPVAWIPELRLLLQRAVPGASIEPALLQGDRDLGVRLAFALHHFHTSGLDLGRTHDLQKELSPLPGRAGEVSDACPELGDTAGALLRRIETVDAARFAWRRRPVHRDFYHDQVLAQRHHLTVLDLDDAAMSEPAVDVANFAAHLLLLGAQKRGDISALRPVIDAVIDQYRELDSDLDPGLLAFLTSTTLLRLAGIHVTRENGPRVARSLLQASAGHLAAVERAALATR